MGIFIKISEHACGDGSIGNNYIKIKYTYIVYMCIYVYKYKGEEGIFDCAGRHMPVPPNGTRRHWRGKEKEKGTGKGLPTFR